MSFLDDVTPLLITWDEAPNIARVLRTLAWARDILVVDSGSTDGTLEAIADVPRVRVLHRPFDNFASQCAYGLEHGEIGTEWVLSLDADHLLTPDGQAELASLEPADDVAGYRAAFTYCIQGRPLRGSLYPARTVLFRRHRGRYLADGHGHRIEVDGRVGQMGQPILHDDRKSLARWLRSQDDYAQAEMEKLVANDGTLPIQDRVRKLAVVAPFAALFYSLFVKGCLFDGRAGWHYAFQRMIAETVLSLKLLERRIGRDADEGDPGRQDRP